MVLCVAGVMSKVGTECEGGVDWYGTCVAGVVCQGTIGGRGGDTKETWEWRRGEVEGRGGEGWKEKRGEGRRGAGRGMEVDGVIKFLDKDICNTCAYWMYDSAGIDVHPKRKHFVSATVLP